MEEEKQRKTFQNQLPKLEEEVKNLVADYKQTNGGAEFTIYGLSFTEFIHTKRVDYEESKEMERKEKQIMRDTVKKNETRYGSKPITPLALKKRKATGTNQDTQLQTPGKVAKYAKLEMPTPSSRVVNASKNPTPAGVAKSRLVINPKRKSKTPRRSK